MESLVAVFKTHEPFGGRCNLVVWEIELQLKETRPFQLLRSSYACCPLRIYA